MTIFSPENSFLTPKYQIGFDRLEQASSSPLNEFYTSIIEKSFRFPFVFIFLALILAFAGNVLFVIAVLFITNRIMNFRVRQKE